MLSVNRIKFLRSLSAKKTRVFEGLFTVEGAKPVAELLGSAIKIHSVYAVDEWITQHKQLLAFSGAELVPVTYTELERISQLATPNQVFAVAHQPQAHLDLNTLGDKLVLALDDVSDPGNMGTIIRIADWFGIDTIVCSPNTVEQYNPKTVQATMGSLFRVNVFYTDLLPFVEDYKKAHKNPVCAAVLGGDDLYASPVKSPCLLLMGSESHGLSVGLINASTHKITIPAAVGSKAESLNVGVGTAIIVSELRRR
ncbi:MAG: RNA methyltransferase [Sphingobacteriales bacterium JAD_PAG50586_3]|nr:MAG: RNA methyltransferase [Sphingobacteriales bacterium JAD_PAG50586_3]